jgi:hypothetical protein
VFLIIVTHTVWDTLRVHSVVLKIVRRLCILRREMLVRAICETAVKRISSFISIRCTVIASRYTVRLPQSEQQADDRLQIISPF